MKNLKKLLAVIITVALMATMMVPVFAADEISADAEICANLNLLLGEDDGVTSEYLAKNTERIQTAIVFLRLLGKEAEAVSFDGEENFADADKVAWKAGRNVLAYLKANDDLGWVGNPDGTFDPNSKVTPQMIYKVILEVLGYKAGDGEDFDFSWKETLDFAADKGLDKVADLKNLTNDDLAAAIVEALKAETVDGEVLVEKLVEDGIIDKDDAIAEGLIEDELKVESVSAVDLNKVKVVFNKAVDTTKASFTIKRGAAVYASTVEWNEAKNTATLTAIINLPAADYAVEIKGLTDVAVIKSFTVLSETVSGIEVVSTKVAYKNDETIAFKVSNQYGNALSTVVSHDDLYAKSVYNVTKGKAIATAQVAGKSELKLTNLVADPVNAAIGDVLRVTVSYKGFTAQANVTVAEVSASDAITLGAVVLAKDDVRLNKSDETVELSYTLTDQFGNVKKLSANKASASAIEAADGVLFVSSNSSVISGFSTDADGKLILTIAGDGSAIITAFINKSGIVTSTTVAVEKDEEPTAVVIAAPTMIVAAGDKEFDLGITITDQYGTIVKKKDGLSAQLKDALAGTNLTIKDEKALSVDLSAVTLTETKTITIEIKRTSDSKVIGSVSFNVEPNAEVSYIKSVTFGPKFEVSAVATLDKSDIVAIDQYGREISAAGFTVAKKVDTETVFTLAGSKFTAGAAAGTQEFTVTLNGKTKDIKLQVITSADIKSYSIEDIPTIYKSADAKYHKEPVLVGKTEAGETVILVSGKITALTTSNAAVAKITSGKVEGVAAGTATITAWNNATVLASVAVTVSDEAPVAKTIKFIATTATADGSIESALEIKDQYGADITSAEYSKGTVVGATTEGTREVSFITQNGLIATATVTFTAAP